ncbi:MAG: carboxypeptidase regulatory-like domain-containing protein [Chitinophagales bacterium]|nr:carboxypeptidase regulatory-like domain-containing protein [Chitinophagales bacterium]
MLLHFRLHYLFVWIMFFMACDKTPRETTVNGVVLDKITGQPIPGASIAFQISLNSDLPPNIDYEDIITNVNGGFSFSNTKPIRIHDIQKIGYLPKGSKPGIPVVVQEEVNYFEIFMTPMDGVLKLNLVNQSNFLDTLYIGIYSPSQKEEYEISNGVMLRQQFVVSELTSINSAINLASEDSIGIYWGFTSLPFDIKDLPFHDYVSVTRNDTTSFTISF